MKLVRSLSNLVIYFYTLQALRDTLKSRFHWMWTLYELDNFCNNFCYSLWLLACLLVLDSHILVYVLFLTSRKCFIIMVTFRIHEGYVHIVMTLSMLCYRAKNWLALKPLHIRAELTIFLSSPSSDIWLLYLHQSAIIISFWNWELNR